MEQLELGTNVYMKKMIEGRTEIISYRITGIENGIRRIPDLESGCEIEDEYIMYTTANEDTFYHSDIGHIVFLTREEAEKCTNTPFAQLVEKVRVWYDGENWIAQLLDNKYSLTAVANSPIEAFIYAVNTIRERTYFEVWLKENNNVNSWIN